MASRADTVILRKIINNLFFLIPKIRKDINFAKNHRIFVLRRLSKRQIADYFMTSATFSSIYNL